MNRLELPPSASRRKKADASGAAWAVLIGQDEMANNTLTVKHLRDASVGQTQLASEAALVRMMPETMINKES